MNTRILKALTAFSIAISIMSGCSDDDEPGVKNSLTINGSSFKVATVSLIGVSIDNEGHAGVSFTSTDGTKTKTLTVDFEYSPLEDLDGTYSYPQLSTTRYLDDFLSYYAEFNGSTEMTSTNLESGSFTLKDNGNSNFTFTLDLKMIDGTIFKGSYQGKVVTVFNNG